MVRYGIIGAGKISHKFALAVHSAKNSTLTAVASRDIQNAKYFAMTNNIPLAYGDYDELLKSNEIDVVYIGTVNQTHMEIIEKAISYKIPVICEKPIVTKLEQMEKIIALSKKHDVLVMEAMWTRFLPTIQKAKEWIDSNMIGKINNIETEFSFALSTFNENSRLLSTEYEGGAMYDIGVYCIELTTYFAKNNIKELKSMSKLFKTGTDIDSTTLIRFEDDIMARMSFGFTTPRKNDAYIFGDKGYIHFKCFHNCKEITLYDLKNQEVNTFVDKDFNNGFIYQVEHFSQLFLVGKKESDIMPFSDNIKTIKIYDDIKSQW